MSAVGRQHERPRANTAPSPAKPAVRSDLQVRSVRRQVSTPGLHAIPRSMVSLYLAFVLELSCAISHDIYNLGTNPRAYTETSCLGSAALEHCWGILPLQISGVLALRGGAKTHLRYWRHPDGHRVYTVEKIDPNGRPTLPAHPPPIPLTDTYSRQRVTLKLRHGLIDEVTEMEELRAAMLKKMDDPAMLGQPDTLSSAQEAAIRRMYQEKVDRGEASAHREMLWFPQQPRGYSSYPTADEARQDQSTAAEPARDDSTARTDSPGGRQGQGDGTGARQQERQGLGGRDAHPSPPVPTEHHSPTSFPPSASPTSFRPSELRARSDFTSRSTLPPSPARHTARAGCWDEEEEGRVGSERARERPREEGRGQHAQEGPGRREGGSGRVAGGVRERRLAKKRQRERDMS